MSEQTEQGALFDGEGAALKPGDVVRDPKTGRRDGMRLYLFGLFVLIVGLSVLAAPGLPVMAQGCGCGLPGPEPRSPAHAWLPLVMAQPAPTALLYPPPVMPEEPESAMPLPDKPVRPPTDDDGPVYLPIVGGGP